MDQVEVLLTIAELGVALAGFASIVTVIGRRQNGETHELVGARLRTMLEVALRNAAFALLPLPFLQLLPSDPIVWRVGSGLYVIAVGLHWLRVRGTIDEGWWTASNLLLVVLTGVVAVANVLGLAGSKAFSLYLANLLLGLAASGISFLSVATTIFRVERE